MGTSKSNTGPKDNSPLLPPWAPAPPLPDAEDLPNDNGDEEIPSSDANKLEESPLAVINNLSKARRNLSSFSRDKTERSFNKAARSYVKSYGGGKKAASTAIGGKVAGRRFAGFLSDLANRGIRETLESLGLAQYLGESVDFILSKIADTIAPAGATNEEAVARKAIIEALGFIYQTFEIEAKNIQELDSMNQLNMELVIKEYVSCYIFHRWLHELGLKIEEKSPSTRDLVKTEKEAKKFIKAAVDLDLGKYNLMSIDFKSGEGKAIVDKIFEEAYILIEQL